MPVDCTHLCLLCFRVSSLTHAIERASQHESMRAACAASCSVGLVGEAAAHCTPHSQQVSRTRVDACSARNSAVRLRNTFTIHHAANCGPTETVHMPTLQACVLLTASP